MRLLHISDLHYRRDSADDGIEILNAASVDISSLARDRIFDAVIFTGDLVYSGTNYDDFGSAMELCILPLLEASGTQLNQFVVVPGNHDIDREKVSPLLERSIADGVDSAVHANQLVDDANAMDFRNARLANFYTFVEDFWPGSYVPNELGRVCTVETNEGILSVAAANSAWRCTGRAENSDRHKVLVTERQIDSLITAQASQSPTLRVFAAHHPFDWLADFDRDQLLPVLSRNFDAALFGHTHTPLPVGTATASGQLFVNTTGSLFQEEGRVAAFTVLDFDIETQSVTAIYRRHFSNRRAFDSDNEVAENGTHVFSYGKSYSRLSTNVFKSIAVPVDHRSALRESLNLNVSIVQQTYLRSDAGLELLIEPAAYFARESRHSLFEEDGSQTKRVPLVDWCEEPGVTFILGERESGKTSALLWMLRETIDVGDTSAIYVDLRHLDRAKSALRKTIRSRFRAAGISTSVDLSDAPNYVLALDNFDPKNDSHFDWLKGIQRENVTSTYVALEDNGFVRDPSGWALGDLEVRVCYLGDYAGREIRALANSIYPELPKERARDLINSALSVMVNQNLKRSPWAIVMVLLIFQHEPAFQYSDVTNLVDKYLDLVLGKWAAGDDEVIGYDHGNRKHFLISMAVEFEKTKRDAFSEDELIQFANHYVDRYGPPLDGPTIVKDLITRRIIGGDVESVAFSLGDVQQFLLASAVTTSIGVTEDYLLQDPDHFFNAIVHLAGLTRDPKISLEHLSSDLSSLLDTIGGTQTTLFNSLDESVWGKVPGLEETLEGLERLGAEVVESLAQDSWERDADELLDQAKDEDDASSSRESETANTKSGEVEAGLARLLEVNALFSLCIQRSDHIGDQGLRLKYAESAVKGWATLFIAVCAFETTRTDAEKESLIERLKEAGYSGRRAEAVVQFGAFYQTLNLVNGLLSTPKLRSVFQGFDLQSPLDSGDMVTSLLVWSLMVNEFVDGWSDYTNAMTERFKDRAHALYIVETVLFNTYCDPKLDPSKVESIEKVFLHVLALHDSGRRSSETIAKNMQLLQSSRENALFSQRMKEISPSVTEAPDE